MINCAMIGYGYWGKIIHRYIESSGKFSLCKIYSRSLPVDNIFIDEIDDIGHNLDIEAVFIVTPAYTHMYFIKKAISFNKHIFCEKPLCAMKDDIDVLYNIKNRYNKSVFIDYIYTFSPSINKIRELLQQIGAVESVQATIVQFGKFYAVDNVYETLAVHMLSAIVYILNADMTYSPVVRRIDVEKDENGVVISGAMFFNIKGINCTIASSLTNPHKQRQIIIKGSKGIIIFDMLDEENVKLHTFDNIKTYTDINYKAWKYDESNNLSYALKAFYESVRTGNDNFEFALNVQKMLSGSINIENL